MRLSEPARSRSNKRSKQVKLTGLVFLDRLLGHGLTHHPGHHCKKTLAAISHRFREIVRRHVGVDHVLFGIVDVLQLVFELQHAFQAILQHSHRVPARLGPLGNAGSLGRDQFIEHDVVSLESLVEGFVIVLISDVYGPDQVNRYARGVVWNKLHHGRL